MSATVNRVSVELFEGTRYGEIAGSIGLLAIVLLFVLLLAHELVRAYGGRPVATGALRALQVGAVPLLASAGMVILLRTLQFL
jgi:hypothetical protein